MYANAWGTGNPGWGSVPSYMTGGLLGGITAWLGVLLVPMVIWALAWKGWALWKAAKNDSKPWFIALLLINTLGILDILYIFLFGAKKAGKRK